MLSELSVCTNMLVSSYETFSEFHVQKAAEQVWLLKAPACKLDENMLILELFFLIIILFYLLSGPVQSVIWLRVRDVCIGASVQGVLQWDERKQRRPGVFAIPQRNHIRLRWGMRKLTLGSPAAVSASLLEHFVFSASFSLSLPLCVSFPQLLSKPKFSSVEKIKTIGSTYMAAAGLTQLAPGDERKVCDPEVTALGYHHAE